MSNIFTMSRRFSFLISLGCITTIAVASLAALCMLFNIDWFADLAKSNLDFRMQWPTVQQWQWYSLWALTTVYLSIGLIGLYFLHCAFSNIATGELFNLSNSLNIRRFAILLIVQGLAGPLYFSLSSILLSINHPAGEKMLYVAFGSNEIFSLALALIFWVLSDLLVMGSKLQSENQQFV